MKESKRQRSQSKERKRKQHSRSSEKPQRRKERSRSAERTKEAEKADSLDRIGKFSANQRHQSRSPQSPGLVF